MLKSKNSLFAIATAIALVPSSHAASILLGGFDGTQTQNTIAPAIINGNSGVRELNEGFKQDAGAVGNISARIWTDQTTNKELQWAGTTRISTTTGNWGLTDFTTDAQTGSGVFVVTQQNPSWINFEITNTGATGWTLDKFHIAAQRTGTGAPTTLTLSLQQNGTFADPPVLSASDLTAVAPVDISLAADTSWNGYEIALSGVSSTTLGVGETATYRIANNTGTARLYLDNIAISGTISAVPEPSSAALIGLAGLGLLARRRRA